MNTNRLKVKHIETFEYKCDTAWDDVQEHHIDNANWKEYSYVPMVTFKIVHNSEMVFIKYEIKELYAVRTVGMHDQDPVWEDSCVEFFIEDKEGIYHNFEFNSKGVCLSAYGKTREGRTPRNSDALSKVIRHTSNVVNIENQHYWTLTIGIPFDILGLKSGKEYPANFYKCGDKTEKVHFLSWNKIKTETPDFHCPSFFGKIVLE